jgi:pyruvate dehydrogenase E1 component alpha subunit
MACGAARMFKNRGEPNVAVPFFGDGAMNQGVLLESLNVAAVWDIPVVFVCENNQYAITSPISEMTRGPLADRAAAFGLEAETVDGMDVEAVGAAASRLVTWARAGKGAGFLECRTYRFEAHNTALRNADPRTPEEIARWRERDPLKVAARRLDETEGWGATDQAALDAEVDAEIEDAIDRARACALPGAETARDHMYAQTYPGFPAGVLE